jgi:hypothetical protein
LAFLDRRLLSGSWSASEGFRQLSHVEYQMQRFKARNETLKMDFKHA